MKIKNENNLYIEKIFKKSLKPHWNLNANNKMKIQ